MSAQADVFSYVTFEQNYHMLTIPSVFI
uniref:Uncharacterized protein n=1 Tax=Arundo donax TaxID=35708 RepID=A0A0A9CJJ0_ARUDO